MASRKMTFTLAEDLASRFVRRVAPRERSRYVAEAIAEKLAQREKQLMEACDAANSDTEVAAVVQDWQELPDEMTEPWNDDAPAR